ncbi:type II toxin-antitoxin system VapC family toxin [Kordiimonas lipolytica]|uniref:Ribonuclease VapC n=1 Tax=Kordiimonas lipolytica TaxID=1662421 RepID=A0ABV8UBS2_9PROT|nr:type II toxin-antitoxin system VapC family toxin [Kordiimonas lipolytica]
MIVVDTSAIMAVLLSEPRADEIIRCLSDNDLCMSAGTLSELMIVAAARGLADELNDTLEAIGMEIANVDGAIAKGVQEAFLAWGKGRHPASLNFGDCFAYATAKSMAVPLLFVGDDFSQTDVGVALQ